MVHDGKGKGVAKKAKEKKQVKEKGNVQEKKRKKKGKKGTRRMVKVQTKVLPTVKKKRQ